MSVGGYISPKSKTYHEICDGTNTKQGYKKRGRALKCPASLVLSIVALRRFC